MSVRKIKYFTTGMQLWILRVALLFSVFAFSGFNGQVPTIPRESVKTELVESGRHHHGVKTLSFKHFRTYFSLSKVRISINPWAIFNFNRGIVAKYRMLCKNHLDYTFFTITMPIKMPCADSEEELFPSSIG